MKIALIHEWLTTHAGSERVLEALIRLYPTADVFAVVDFLPADERAWLQGKTPKPTFIQKLPFAQSKFRHYLPLMPLAIEQLDLSGYDLILSSHHAVAKGVITGPNQLHISYVHSPMRYAWDLQHQYLRESSLDRGIKSGITRYLLHRLRLWDQASANRVDHFVSNSDFIKKRIWRCYRREAMVIHPPVEVSRFGAHAQREGFYLAASRMVPYKRMNLIVEAFSQTPHRKLIVIGDGPEMGKIRKLAGSNVTLMGYQEDSVLKTHLEKARAFVFAAEEDFGILPVEAQAAGAPVIAFGKGGALETVIPLDHPESQAPTGLFFKEQTAESLLQALDRFEAAESQFSASEIRAHAEKFSTDRFLKAYSDFVKGKVEEFWPDREVS
jgi:glycosyltransferase involved in cell wall biosynthesis